MPLAKKRGFYSILLLLSFSVMPSMPVLAESFIGEVVAVSSGDTIKVLRAGRVIAVRLEGIDCPDKEQGYSEEAKRFTEDFVFGKKVAVKVSRLNRRGQVVGQVILADGKNLNEALVKAGLAWWRISSSRDQRLGRLEREARNKRLGLWQEARPLPPWEYPNQRKLAMTR